jgi:predicted AAA+ superfamily ATPase
LPNEVNEPLTGRKYELKLFPISFSEMVKHVDLRTEIKQLENRLVFGSYPEIVTDSENRIENLRELTSSYLYKDVFKFGHINKPNELQRIVQLLAHQIGSEIVVSELAQAAGTSSQTVKRYIDILEKAFIVFRLPALSRNVRNEIKKSKKLFFYDNGIRNAVIANYNLLNNRTDIGILWENYLVSERIKKNAYANFYGHTYFWRTKQQQEIDYLEEAGGKMSAYEFKWNPNKKPRWSKTFTNAYDTERTAFIHRENYHSFLM